MFDKQFRSVALTSQYTLTHTHSLLIHVMLDTHTLSHTHTEGFQKHSIIIYLE